MAVLNQIVVKDALTVRNDICRTMRNGLIVRGVTNPNVAPGSDTFVLATAVGNEIAVVGANTIYSNEQQMPDSAVAEGLARIGRILKKGKQTAAGSVGYVLVDASAATVIPTGHGLIDDTGLRFEVVVGGPYDDGDPVLVRAIDIGDATNHAAGDVLRWASAPPFCDEKAVVDTGGLVNGVDDEDDEAYRLRVIAVYQNPPKSGSWQHVADDAEASIGSVQKAFPFPAIYGPATMAVAVTAAPTKTSKSRVLASTTVTSIVKPYIIGLHPQHADIDVTSVVDVNADVAIGLTLPEAPTANPPGPGGGWKDGSPWPRPDGSSTFRCTVTAVTSTTQFSVDATVSPTLGVSRIAWLSPTDWKLYQAVVANVSGTSGAYLITLDRPFVGITTGCYIWPDIENAQTFVDSLLAAFAIMGPGEKTANAAALVRGFRHPPPSVGWPSAVGPTLLRALVDASESALDAQYLHRTNGTTTLTGNAGQLAPSLPPTIDEPPRILVPRHVAFYRAP